MMLTSLRRAFAAIAFTTLAHAVHAQAVPTETVDPLYGALGGKPGITALIDDFVPRVGGDARIGRYFARTDLGELKKQLIDQFCVVAGGPCVYDGATMKKSHAELGIGKADFNRMVELLQRSMDAYSVPFADQNRLLARLAPMNRDIVER